MKEKAPAAESDALPADEAIVLIYLNLVSQIVYGRHSLPPHSDLLQEHCYQILVGLVVWANLGLHRCFFGHGRDDHLKRGKSKST